MNKKNTDLCLSSKDTNHYTNINYVGSPTDHSKGWYENETCAVVSFLVLKKNPDRFIFGPALFNFQEF